MLTRTISGAVFIALLVGAIVLGPITMFILFFVLTLMGTHESYRIAVKAGTEVQKWAGVMASGATYGLLSGFFLFKNIMEKHLMLILVFPFLILILELFRKKKNPLLNIAATIFGIFYVAVPFAILSFLAVFDTYYQPYNPGIVLGFFILAWANDTGAYLSGRAFGRTKLFQRISPNKTWEGAIGGLAINLVVAWLLSMYFHELSIQSWAVIAGIVSVAGTFGDLVESMFKRSTGIKDSGRIMPGHGGVLDRFDSVLVSAPFVAVYLAFISW